MRNRKMLAGVIALTLVLSACAKNEGNEGKASNSGASPTASQPAEGTASASSAAEENPFKMAEPVDVSIIKSVVPDLKLPPGESIEDNHFAKYLAEKTNIHFKVLWYATGDDFTQKQKLAIASNDLPDVMSVDETTFRSLVEGGQVEDLSESFNKYASDKVKEMYGAADNRPLEKATIDGKLYAMPNISVLADSISMAWVRQDWLDKLKLPAPKTVDDIATIAKAFVEQDPDGNKKNDTVGLLGNNVDLYSFAYTNSYDFTAIFHALDSYPGLWLKDESGKVVYGSTTPETKQTLAKLKEMYNGGMIDKEFMIRKEPSQLVNNGKAGLFFGPWWAPWPLGDSIKVDKNADWKPFLLQDSQGKYNTHMVPSTTQFLVVKKGFKHPEALVKHINFYLSNGTGVAGARDKAEEDERLDYSLLQHLYPLYTTFDYPDAVARKHDMLKKALDGQISPEELTPEMKGHYERWQRDLKNPKADPGDWSAPYAYLYGGGLLTQKMDKEVYNAFTATTKTMNQKWANLLKMEKEVFFKIVAGDKPVEDFDKFVEDWKKQGGDQIIAEIEAELQK